MSWKPRSVNWRLKYYSKSSYNTLDLCRYLSCGDSRLDKQCSKQEAVIENFNILIINRGIPAAV